MNKILFASSECVPFVKTGGLADVCGALPKEFSKEYFDVRVVLPYYTFIPEKYKKDFKYLTSFQMNMGPLVGTKYVGVFEYELDGVIFYFIDNHDYFDCFYPYSEDRWDLEKFIFFVNSCTVSIFN